jgi:hypothetical protein
MGVPTFFLGGITFIRPRLQLGYIQDGFSRRGTKRGAQNQGNVTIIIISLLVLPLLEHKSFLIIYLLLCHTPKGYNHYLNSIETDSKPDPDWNPKVNTQHGYSLTRKFKLKHNNI